MIRAYLHLVATGVASAVDKAARLTGRTPSAGNLEIETLTLAAAGRQISAGELVTDLELIHRAARDMGGFFGAPGQARRFQRVKFPPPARKRAVPPGIEPWAHGGNDMS